MFRNYHLYSLYLVYSKSCYYHNNLDTILEFHNDYIQYTQSYVFRRASTIDPNITRLLYSRWRDLLDIQSSYLDRNCITKWQIFYFNSYTISLV